MAQSIRELLDSREREVRKAIDDLKTKQLLPLEQELAEIVAARSAISGGIEIIPANDSDIEDSCYMRMTYEELAVAALQDMLTPEGTINEILSHIRNQFNREIAQGSFSPILSRMRDKGKLTKRGKTWILPDDEEDEFGGL